MTRSVTLFRWSHSITHSSRGFPPTLTSPFGVSWVIGRSRRPSPPERITAVLGVLIYFTHEVLYQLEQEAQVQWQASPRRVSISKGSFEWTILALLLWNPRFHASS